MIEINNNWIVVSSDDKSYRALESYLIFTEPPHKMKVRGREIEIPPKDIPLYYKDDDSGSIYIPVGYLLLLKDYIDINYDSGRVIDNRTKSGLYNSNEVLSNIESYRSVLDGIELRDNQIIALRKILAIKRCIIQLNTGAGKTEIMCALVKILSEVNTGLKIPTTLVMEPTARLVNDTIDRFKKYDINVVNYNENRKIIKSCVNICHPKSLGNDLDKYPNHLDDVQVLIGDECHHMRSESFRKPTYSMKNLVYCIGLSASAIEQDRVMCKKIHEFSYAEALTIGATGPLVMNVKADSMIEDGDLAEPVLVVMKNLANEPIRSSDITNWHIVSKIRLESDTRSRIICSTAEFFHYKERKCLILVRTIRWAKKILEIFHEYGLSDYVRASYGGGRFESYNGYEFIPDTDDVFDKFKRGEFTILIGTSHIYEGADVPNLDTLILAYGGKGERLQIQGIGRVLRKTKNGNKAWIIDFTDDEDVVLSSQLRRRMYRYKNIIGIKESDIYTDVNILDLDYIFNKYENKT